MEGLARIHLLAFPLGMVLVLSGEETVKQTPGKTEGGVTLNPLTAEEARVIIHKGTEPPFTGALLKNKEKGTYLCRQCDAPLYRSNDKFESHCGWPSFDDEIPGAVKRVPDPDGRRTEILCVRCGGHLGHVFLGEKLTAKDTRHCVNSLSLKFQPAGETIPKTQAAPPQKTGRAIFAGGCFWGVEYHFEKAPGVLSAVSGYIGGTKENPTYREVCGHGTGHAEAVEVAFDPDKTSFEELCKLFFEIHDPAQVNGQGPDLGEQYRSEVFYVNPEQKEVAEKLMAALKAKGLKTATKLTPAGEFWPAEEYHQDYYAKTGKKPYCHVRTKRF
jgi:peptide methionine sulfoxide reductase msrA/msrB